MKRVFCWLMLTALLGTVSSPATAQEKPADDPLNQNAALSYWQAFALMPSLSEAERGAVGEAATVQRPLDDRLKEIVEQSESALHFLHRGTSMPRAAWGLAYEEGPYVMMPHVSKSRELGRLAVLRAHVLFNGGKPKEALDDVIAALTLGRHVGQEGVVVLISVLVDYAIEAVTIDGLAHRLPELDQASLALVRKRLDDLPKSRDVSHSVRGEKAVFLTWLIKDLQKPGAKERLLSLVGDAAAGDKETLMKFSEQELLAGAKQLGPYFDRLVELSSLPPFEAKQKEDELMAELKGNRAVDRLGSMLLPSVAAGRQAEAAHLTRLALLDAGLAVLREGRDALNRQEHRDPFGDGPFSYRQTKGGFVVASDWKRNDQPITLTFGPPEPNEAK